MKKEMEGGKIMTKIVVTNVVLSQKFPEPEYVIYYARFDDTGISPNMEKECEECGKYFAISGHITAHKTKHPSKYRPCVDIHTKIYEANYNMTWLGK